VPLVNGWWLVYNLPGVDFRDIEFVGRQIGYVVGGPPEEVDGPATIVKTTDGGVTWTPQTLSTASWMDGLTCKDANTCWIGGKYGAIQRTLNGQTWQWANNQSDMFGYLISAQWTGSGDTVLIGGSHSRILRATDGYNFFKVTLPGDADQWDLACPSAGNCYSAASQGSVFHSIDNGVTWRRPCRARRTLSFWGSVAATITPVGLPARAA
jgi:photosystem II stability/assembly factor-like uncharacterized protein